MVGGDGRGRAIGLPTANLEIPADTALPSRGVYAGAGGAGHGPQRGGGQHRRGADLRRAPTRATLRVEAFLLDHDGSDLYGQTMRIDFIERLRDEKRFEGAEALMAQVTADIARTRELAALHAQRSRHGSLERPRAA